MEDKPGVFIVYRNRVGGMRQRKKRISVAIFSGSGRALNFCLSGLQLGLLTSLIAIIPALLVGAGGYYFFYREPVSLEHKEALLERRIGRLADEIVRVQQYEKELQSRADYVEAILKDAEALELNSSRIPSGGIEEPKAEEGVGGGIESTEAIFSEQSSTARRVTPRPERKNLLGVLEAQIEDLKAVPLGSPVDGKLTSKFGRRRSPFTRRRSMHYGLDIGVSSRSPVKATADGKVVRAGYRRGLGRIIVIDHGNGVRTTYGHLHRIHVKRGQKICRGQQIGLAGSSGRSTGPHVHYEIRVNGKRIDPLPFVQMASDLGLLS